MYIYVCVCVCVCVCVYIYIWLLSVLCLSKFKAIGFEQNKKNPKTLKEVFWNIIKALDYFITLKNN